jgi:hypothetical protein
LLSEHSRFPNVSTMIQEPISFFDAATPLPVNDVHTANLTNHSLTWQLNYKQCNRNKISTPSAPSSVTDNSTLWLEVSRNYGIVTLCKRESFFCYCKCGNVLAKRLNSKWLKHNTAGSGGTHHIPTIFYYYSLHMVNTDHNPSPHRLTFQDNIALMAQKMFRNSPTSSKMVSIGNLLCLFSFCIENVISLCGLFVLW